MTKHAFITGLAGQDGAYLARFLLQQGYRVHGLVTRFTPEYLWRLRELGIQQDVILHEGDVIDLSCLIRAIDASQAEELYHLAAKSSVASSLQQPVLTTQVTGLAAAHALEAARIVNPAIRFFQASSSELFGFAGHGSCNEETPLRPRNPYAVAKLFAHWLTVSYRTNYGMHASCGIMFNHESPLRSTQFVVRKVTDAVARIKLGFQRELRLGNVDVCRDWGYAGDYVEAMWLMLQQDVPDDYVIGTGRMASVREICRIAFEHVGLRMDDYLVIDEALKRPSDSEPMYADASKATKRLGWQPKTTLDSLIAMMVDADLKRVRQELH